MRLRRYSKLWAHLAGAVVVTGMLAASKYYELEIPGFEAVALTVIVQALSAWGVYSATNKE